MKKCKKILALILVLAMSLMVFAACGNSDADKAEEVANSFLSAVTTFNFSEALNYMDEDSDFYNDSFGDMISEFGINASDMEDFDLKEYMSSTFNEMFAGIDFLSDDIDSFVDSFVDLVLDNCSYEIEDIEVADGKATAAISVTFPDMDSIDFDEIAENASSNLGLDDDALGEEFLQYVLNELGTDDTDALNYISEDDLARYFAGFFADSGIISEMFNYMLVEIEDQLDTYTESGELELELIDGNWLIVDGN